MYFKLYEIMKKIALLIVITLASYAANAQTRTIPTVDLKTLDGKTVNTKTIDNGDNPVVISFWATWCKPCILELTNIAEVYEQWAKETGVKIIAISIDDARNAPKVPTFVDGKGWDYEVYLDSNGDLKRMLGVNNVPHTFLLDKDNNIVWEHNSYTQGDEHKLLEMIKKVKAGEVITH